MASSMTRAERKETSCNHTSPVHDAMQIPRATYPGHSSSAPSQMKTAAAAICQTRWNSASSPVSQLAKKLTPRECQRWDGRNALNVNQAPTRLTARKTQGIACILADGSAGLWFGDR